MSIDGDPLGAPTLTRPPATIDDWRVLPEDERAELIDGVIVRKASPRYDHASLQGRILALLIPRYDGPPGGAERPGGWWLGPEVDIELEGGAVRPDIAGWRREHGREPPMPAPGARATNVRPDWICEVLSPSTADIDLGPKLGLYHRNHVGHYWVASPEQRTLTVYRWTTEGYLHVVTVGREAKARLEPFDAAPFDAAEAFAE
jgi:Uma2 family endonuclease